MVIYVEQFFTTMLGVDLPTWFYNAIALIILMAFVLSVIKIVFPRLSKYVTVTVIAVTLGYLAYEILPVWGIAITGAGG